MAGINDDEADLPRSELYEDPSDQKKHLAAMQTIAEEIGRPLPEIRECYEDTLEVMAGNASVTDFLPILVSKKVKQRYRKPLI